MKQDTKQDFDNICADLAQEVHHLLIENCLRRDYTVRHNKIKGAYVSLEDYNNDDIILRSDSRFTSLTFRGLVSVFKSKLSNQPIFKA